MLSRQKKSETRVTAEKLGEAEVLFAFFVDFGAEYTVQERCSVRPPFFSLFF
jgi:hypothetical protein